MTQVQQADLDRLREYLMTQIVGRVQGMREDHDGFRHHLQEELDEIRRSIREPSAPGGGADTAPGVEHLETRLQKWNC